MERKITCFIPWSGEENTNKTVTVLKASDPVSDVYVIGNDRAAGSSGGAAFISTEGFASTGSIRKMAELASTRYVVIYSKPMPPDPGQFALERMIQVCESTGAGMVYSGYRESKGGKVLPHPVIDYQEGSLRDDFNFGSTVLYRSDAIRDAVSGMKAEYRYAGLYDLRLRISQKYAIVHIPELLYTEIEEDVRQSGEKQFDYVDPRNRSVQIEMEQACTDHLKAVGAWLKPDFRSVNHDDGRFSCEASVIIPVRNRAKTIGDAINSVLSQKAGFRFNLIIIDNHSTDGTTDIIKSFAGKDNRIVHIVPRRNDLGIGGCWNEGIFHSECGRFAIQLDSDDLYIDDNVISRIVEALRSEKCGMLVGSYKMVNFRLEEIPPGIIDHREWTPDNGPNNALRINGLGAPRAFYTPLLREIRIPDVSYGEDYAVGLAVSRLYRIGRIYEPLYLCRRWEENSDAALDTTRVNANNFYKDRLRTIELAARKKLNREGSR
jgi:hypothetical protein